MNGRWVLIAGGGTGGHLFPGVAAAQALKALAPDIQVAFVSAGKALESRVLKEAGWPLLELKVAPLRGAGLAARLKSLVWLPGAVLAARRLIGEYRPALVLAVGGYAAFPLGCAAWLCRVPLVVQEQNAAPGLTNRLLGKLAKLAFIAFPAAADHFPAGRARLTGNPLRAEVLEQARAARRSDPGQEFRVLVMGGSQGAHSLNLALMEALPLLAERRERLSFVHQTGQADEAAVTRAYAEHGFAAEARAFFKDVGRRLGQAHLVICRAGAGSISELLAVGRASVLVPYLFAAGDHHSANARAVVAEGAGLMLADADFSGARAAEMVKRFMDDPAMREQMETRALSLARPEAAREMAGQCLALMKEAA
jgi:UDP-N-acetylglucosamine--N-acetylmuramyl-(pentapeptide) pyrophosphoryl-undecaprenol N-acetylglucosamine transferase